MQMPVNPPGVPHPWVPHVHPYPTRYHGGIWKRPVFGLPRVPRPTQVFRPAQLWGLGFVKPTGVFRKGRPVRGLGEESFQVQSGVFRRPKSGGGGVFNRAISGGSIGQIGEGTKIAWFLGAVAAGGLATYYGLKKIKKTK